MHLYLVVAVSAHDDYTSFLRFDPNVSRQIYQTSIDENRVNVCSWSSDLQTCNGVTTHNDRTLPWPI